jgi:hypothetical protein
MGRVGGRRREGKNGEGGGAGKIEGRDELAKKLSIFSSSPLDRAGGMKPKAIQEGSNSNKDVGKRKKRGRKSSLLL